MLTIDDVTAAAGRIAGKVRRTPVLRPEPCRAPLPLGLVLKLEQLQVTGSFKARGALNKLLTLDPDALRAGLVTASGGNHGAAVAHAGWRAGIPTTVFVPSGVSPLKAAKIEGWGARLVVEGRYWDEANAAALRFAAAERAAYVHPFADPAVAAGQGTVALEVLEDAPEVDTLLVAIGGGGLIAGMAVAAKALKPAVRVVGVEPVGCPTMHASLAAGRVVALDRVETVVPTLAARSTDTMNLEVCRRLVDRVVLVSDEAMLGAARALWLELGIAADMSGAASVAALLAGAYAPEAGERVCALVCGAGADGVG
jgi:threonine dehydratase